MIRFIPVWRRNLLVWRKLAVPSILGNLAEVVARQGRRDEARTLFEDLLRRFPAYEAGRKNYQAFYEGCQYNTGLADALFTRESLEQRFAELNKGKKK